MSNATFGLLIAAALVAGPALAQPAPSASETPRAAIPPTVSGVVVHPLPRRTCSSRDKDCISLVVAQLQQLYPKALERWCDAIDDQAAFLRMRADDNLPATRAPTAGEYSPPAVAKAACAGLHRR